jgi:hypothetical protein
MANRIIWDGEKFVKQEVDVLVKCKKRRKTDKYKEWMGVNRGKCVNRSRLFDGK